MSTSDRCGSLARKFRYLNLGILFAIILSFILWMGVAACKASEADDTTTGAGTEELCYPTIKKVLPGSIAEHDGYRVGDQIVLYASLTTAAEATRKDSFVTQVEAFKGTASTAIVLRDGTYLRLRANVPEGEILGIGYALERLGTPKGIASAESSPRSDPSNSLPGNQSKADVLAKGDHRSEGTAWTFGDGVRTVTTGVNAATAGVNGMRMLKSGDTAPSNTPPQAQSADAAPTVVSADTSSSQSAAGTVVTTPTDGADTVINGATDAAAGGAAAATGDGALDELLEFIFALF